LATLVVAEAQTHGACLGPGVAHHIRQCFLDNPKSSHLHGGRQISQISAGFYVDREILTTQATRVGAHGIDQPQIVEGRRSQIVDHAPNIGDSSLGLRREVGQDGVGLDRVALNEVARVLSLQGHGGQDRSQSVM
jgi:hypothetical protein